MEKTTIHLDRSKDTVCELAPLKYFQDYRLFVWDYKKFPKVRQLMDKNSTLYEVFFGEEFEFNDFGFRARVIALNNRGIQNIFKLVNLRNLNGPISFYDLLSYKDNLIILIEKNMYDLYQQRSPEPELLVEDNTNFLYLIKDEMEIHSVFGEHTNLEDVKRDFLDELKNVIVINPFEREKLYGYPISEFERRVTKLKNWVTVWEGEGTYDCEYALERINHELKIIRKNKWEEKFLCAFEINNYYKNKQIPFFQRGAFLSSLICSWEFGISYEPTTNYFCGDCDEHFTEDICPYCKRDSGYHNEESLFEFGFSSRYCIFELNYPKELGDRVDFLNTIFKPLGFMAVEIKSSFDEIKESHQFVLFPYSFECPLERNLENRIVSSYDKEELNDYFPIVGLYYNNYVSINYNYARENDTTPFERLYSNAFDDLIKIREFERIEILRKHFGLEKLVPKVILKFLGIILSSIKVRGYDDLNEIITNKEELYEVLIRMGVGEQKAIDLTNNYLKDKSTREQLNEIYPEFDTETYLFTRAHLIEFMKVLGIVNMIEKIKFEERYHSKTIV